MRILIIGINYSPELTGIAPYTAGLAEGLTERGHDVTVLTGLPHYPQWRIAEGYRGGGVRTEIVRGVTVRRLRHYVPEKPSPRTRIRMEASFARAVMGTNWRTPMLVLAVSPTLLSAAAAVTLARARGIPVGVIVQDVYTSGVVETGAFSGRSADATARLEVAVLRNATGVAVIHDRLADSLTRLGINRSALTVIRNWTHIDMTAADSDFTKVRSRYGWASDEVVVVHSGNMGVKQSLENVVAAGEIADRERAAGASKVRFVLIGHGSQRALLEEKASTVNSVDLVDPVPEKDFRSMLEAADVLLVNEKPGVSDMAVPSKLTSYFISGKPVLAATEPSSGTAHEIRISGAGLLVPPGDPRALLHEARSIAADKVLACQMGKLGQEFAYSILNRATGIQRYDDWCANLVAEAGRVSR